MTVYGLTPQGLVLKPFDQIMSEVEAQQRGDIDPLLYTGAESLIGQINASVVTQIRLLWEAFGAIYAARDPGGASGASLDQVSAITGTTRRAATKGTVVLTMMVQQGFTVPAGSVASVAGQPTNQWVTTEDAHAPLGGPPGPVAVIVDAIAAAAGPFAANAGTITTIATPVSGWVGVTNPNDATPGLADETDPQLRLRREEELTAQGGSQLEAIREALLNLKWTDGRNLIVAAAVDENQSSYTDAVGRPPHTIECVLQVASWIDSVPPDQAAALLNLLAQTLWRVKPGGIAYYGTNVGTTLDSQGIARTIAYTDATTVTVFVNMTIVTDPAVYAGDADLKTRIVAYGSTFLLGQDVVWSKLFAMICDVPGVLDVTDLRIGLGYLIEQSQQNIPIDRHSVAQFSSGFVIDPIDGHTHHDYIVVNHA